MHGSASPYREEGHIGYWEAALLVATVLSSKLLLPQPALLPRAAGPAGWLVVVGMVLLASLGCWWLAALLRRFPGESLPEILRRVAGPRLGLALNLLLVSWLVLDGALALRLFTETFIATILPRTPPSVLSLLALAVAIYAGMLGLETIARANLLLWPLMTLAFVSVIFFVMPQAHQSWLAPFWGPGPAALAVHSLRFTGLLADAALLGLYGYAFRTAGEQRRSLFTGLWLAGLAFIIVEAVFIGVFGAASASQQPFPFFVLARMAYVGRFFQRMEALFVLFWIFAALIRLAIYLHAAAVTVASTLRLPYYRPLLAPLAVLLFSLGLLPRDFMTTVRLTDQLQLLEVIPAFGLPALLLAVTGLRRRREVKGHA